MGRKNVIWIILVVCFSVVNAQIPDKNYVYSSYSGLNADTNIFNDISLSTYELLTTSVQFSKDDDLQKVIFVPFKLLDLNNINNSNFLYNTKLNLAQKSGISTIGVGFTWDNSMPSSKRGGRIFSDFSGKVAAIKAQINTTFSQSLQNDLAKSNSGTLGFVISSTMQTWINNEIAQIAQRGGAYAIPNLDRNHFSAANNLNYEDYLYYKSKKEEYNALTKKKLDTDFTTEYSRALIKNSVKVTFGGNLSFFSILGSDDVDLDNDNLNDNEYSLKQQNLSLGFTHIVNECWGYSLTGYYLEKRAAAEAENDLQPYVGLSAAIGFRTWILDKNYKTSRNYLESLFVPSIHTGLALEHLKCNAGENSDCADGILKTTSITPYLEFKINPKNQFRVGIPITINERIDSESEEIGPFIQWRLQLSGNN